MTFCFLEAKYIFSLFFFVAPAQQLRVNAGRSFTAHTLRFVLQGGVDSGKVPLRMLECSLEEYTKFISTTGIKKNFKAHIAKVN
jgi:hypothetical protein